MESIAYTDREIIGQEPTFTHTATIRGIRDIPVRREGTCWVAKYQVALGLWWSPREVSDLRPRVECGP